LAFCGLLILLAVVLTALLGEVLAPRSPVAQQIRLRLKPPGFVDARSGQTLWLGTDHLGRDIFSRIIYGSRISLVVSLPAVAISAAISLAWTAGGVLVVGARA
jgi:peptide/nickel transport system permease protein